MINSSTRKEIGLKSEFMCFVNELFFTEKIVSVRVKFVVIVNFFLKICNNQKQDLGISLF